MRCLENLTPGYENTIINKWGKDQADSESILLASSIKWSRMKVYGALVLTIAAAALAIFSAPVLVPVAAFTGVFIAGLVFVGLSYIKLSEQVDKLRTNHFNFNLYAEDYEKKC